MSEGVSAARIAELQARWDGALQDVVTALYGRSTEPDLLNYLAVKSQENFQRYPGKQLLIGICGPGAAGKGTMEKYLIEKLGVAKIVNSTTRLAREGEENGKDYYFMDNEVFQKHRSAGAFAVTTERAGRGWYGVSNDEIKSKLAASHRGVLFEENPRNIVGLFDSSFVKGLVNSENVLLIILPPSPIVEASVARLQHRLGGEVDPAKRVLSSVVFESTVGDRQIDEFRSIREVAGKFITLGIQPVFFVNDDLSVSQARLQELFGEAVSD